MVDCHEFMCIWTYRSVGGRYRAERQNRVTSTIVPIDTADKLIKESGHLEFVDFESFKNFSERAESEPEVITLVLDLLPTIQRDVDIIVESSEPAHIPKGVTIVSRSSRYIHVV